MVGRSDHQTRRRVWVSAIFVLGILGTYSPSSTAFASRIRAKGAVATPYGTMSRSFVQFLNAGPTAWAKTQPKVPAGLHILADTSGNVTANAFFDYLTWRRNLNPTRFDYYHPNLVSVLTIPQVTPTVPVTPTTPAVPQVVVPPLVPAVPQVITPEPSSWMIALGLVGTAVWVRRKRPRSSDLLE